MGDQSKIFNKFVEDSEGNLDIVIDDGSHAPSHIQTSVRSAMEPSSIRHYIIEDIETSYWAKMLKYMATLWKMKDL